MGEFTTTPKIELSVALTSHEIHVLEAHIGRRMTVLRVDHYLLDVDAAERAVAWLKAHGVEQEPKAPLRDTERALGFVPSLSRIDQPFRQRAAGT